MSSRYASVYEQWRDRSRKASGPKPPRASTGSASAERIFDAEAGVYGRWFPDATLQRLLQRARPPCRRRARRTGRAITTTAPSPATKQRITYAEMLDEVATLAAVLADLGVGAGRPRHRLHADDPAGDRRHARLRAARRRAFRRVRRLRGQGAGDPHRGRRAEAGPRRLLRHRAGRVVAYKPLLDRALELSQHKPSAVLMFQRPQAKPA